MHYLKWLEPGMGVKRWLLLLVLGITGFSLGIAYILVSIYREQPFPEWVGPATLQFLDRPLRGLLFMTVFGACIGFALRGLGRSILSPFLREGETLVERLHEERLLRKGPKIVAIGGGTGLSTLLRGLKQHSANLTAIVTVADDGGSSGRLRRDLSVPPPGDFRQCIVALAEAEPQMTQLFQYRFVEGGDLKGHSFGNLFIAAMLGVTGGNFERAILETSRVLRVRGQILPSTLADLALKARFTDGTTVIGESQITHAGQPIERVMIEPRHVPAYPDAVLAIMQADLIVVGPGSLYTSVLPNLLVEDIAQALRLSPALKVYVCNVATEAGETDDFKVGDHVQVLARHVGSNPFDFVLANNNFAAAGGRPSVHPVPVNGEASGAHGCAVVQADVIDEANPLRHDPAKLAEALMAIYFERGNGQRQSARASTDADNISAAD